MLGGLLILFASIVLAGTLLNARLFAKRINKPEEKVFIENDANCAALGEAYAGCGNGAKDFVAVTLGTGVGSGVIIGGKIVNGVNYAGGECGHMVIVVDGEQCSCGRKGCWEAYASATALIRQTKKAVLPDTLPSSLASLCIRESGYSSIAFLVCLIRAVAEA